MVTISTNQISHALTLLLGLVASTAFAQNFYTYSAATVPRGSRSCAAEAEEIGARFGEATGLAVFSTECARESFEGFDIVVTYVAPAPVRSVSARYELFGSDDNGSGPFPTLPPLWGVYESFQDCSAAIPALTQDFERKTGLQGVAGYCYRATVSRYALRVDGFGSEPLEAFFNQEIEFQGEADSAFAQDVASVIRQNGGDVRYVTPWGPRVLAMFYAPTRIYVDARTIGLFGQTDNPAQCEIELAETVRALTDIMGAAPTLSRCLPGSDDGTAHINFAFVAQEPATPYWHSQGPVYGQYDACARDRARVIAFVRESTGRDARGAVCVRTSTISPTTYQSVVLGR